MFHDDEIRQMPTKMFYEFISSLEKDYGVKSPKNSDLMEVDYLKEEIIKEISKKEVKERIAQKEREVEYRSFYRETSNGKIELKYSEIAAFLLKRMNILSFHEKLYVYCEGYYKENAGEIQREIKQILDVIGYVTGNRTEPTRQILHELTYTNPIRDYPFNSYPDFIPCLNGVIDIGQDAPILLAHDPKFRFSFQIPVKFNPDASGDEIRNLIESWVNPEDVDVLYQLPAQAFLQAQGKLFKKSYLLEGGPNAGKSSYVKLLIEFFGERNIAGESLQSLSINRFACASLEHKLCNLYDDLSSVPLKFTGEFKKLTGIIDHEIEKKHKDRYMAKIFAVHLFTCNQPPKINEINDDAFFERWNYVEFPNSFDINTGLYQRVFTEENLSGFFNDVVRYVINIRENGLMVKSGPDEVREKWVISSEPVAEFYKKNLQSDSNSFLLKDDVYGAYLAFCEEYDDIPLDKSRFSRILQSFGAYGKRKMISKVQRQVYCGIGWNGNAPHKPVKKQNLLC